MNLNDASLVTLLRIHTLIGWKILGRIWPAILAFMIIVLLLILWDNRKK